MAEYFLRSAEPEPTEKTLAASCAGLTRASIERSLATKMDCRVKPGNDDADRAYSHLFHRQRAINGAMR